MLPGQWHQIKNNVTDSKDWVYKMEATRNVRESAKDRKRPLPKGSTKNIRSAHICKEALLYKSKNIMLLRKFNVWLLCLTSTTKRTILGSVSRQDLPLTTVNQLRSRIWKINSTLDKCPLLLSIVWRSKHIVTKYWGFQWQKYTKFATTGEAKFPSRVYCSKTNHDRQKKLLQL